MISLIVLSFFMIASLVCSDRYKLIPVYALILYCYSIDYLNNAFNIGSDSLGYIAKSYREILFFFLLVVFIQKLALLKKASVFVLWLLPLTLFLLLVGGIKNGFFSAALDWRDSILPIATGFLLAHNRIATLSNINKLIVFALALTTLNSILAIHEYIVFDGDYLSHWRYDFLINARQDLLSSEESRFIVYQIVRDGELRSSGVLASALQYSYLAALSSFYALLRCWEGGKPKKMVDWLYILSLPILLAGVYVSQVRSSIIIFIISTVTLLVLIKKRPTKVVFLDRAALVFILLSYIGLVFIFVFFRWGLDASALGRIPQYMLAFNEFSIIGHGAGRYRGLFDSYFVYGFLTYGVFFTFFILCFIKTIGFCFNKGETGNAKTQFTKKFIFSSLVSAAVISAFQHVSGSLYYQLIWIILFVIYFQRVKSTIFTERVIV